MSRLVAQDLTVRRGARTILDRVSAEIGPGFTAVIGPNGAGKSTLLRCLAGLEPGAVSLDGEPLARIGLKALARRRAFLPQNARAEWPLAVERLVALGLTPVLPAFGGLTAQQDARVAAAVEAFDLTAQRAQPATTLSGGELARAMLARAVVGDPELLIIDEPVTGLDPRHALDTVQRLRALADQGRVVVAALHDLTLAARYATRVIALKNGRVFADGPSEAVITAERLGALFEVEAAVTGQGPGTLVDLARVSPRR